MTTERTYNLVLRDQDGAYYLLTPELLAEARATDDQRAELKQRGESDDTTGYIGLLPTMQKVAPPVPVQDGTSNEVRADANGLGIISDLTTKF